MIVAQFAIPLAAGVAVLFATGFALEILLRSRPTEGVHEAAAPTRDLESSFEWRFLALSLTAASAAAAAIGALLALARDDITAGAIAGLAVLGGAAVAVATSIAGETLGERASERAATAADRTLRQALAITLRAGSAPALAGAALAIGGVAGLFGLATRFAEIPNTEAAVLTLGAGAGAALTALVARLLAPSGRGRAEGPEGEATESAASAVTGAETLALIAAGGAAGLVLGAPLARLTDDTAWLVAPLVALALGLAATTLAAIWLPFFTRILRNAGRAVTVGYSLAATLTAALSFLTPLLLLDEGRWWFAGAALLGAALSLLLFIAGRTLVGGGANARGMGAGAVFTLLIGAALVGAFALGWQVEIAGVSPTATAPFALALAAAGALALAPRGQRAALVRRGRAQRRHGR